MHRRTLPLLLATLLAGTLSSGCIDPKDRRPGLRLSGEVAESPVDDWSFSDAAQEIHLETRTWYGIPHSVTTVCAAVGDDLYVPSVYFEGGEWPGKFWNENVVADPAVRIEIGDAIYERKAVVVEDPEELQRGLQALAAKYPFWREQLALPESERFDMALVRMDPRSDP